jgi:hypothetical protein
MFFEDNNIRIALTNGRFFMDAQQGNGKRLVIGVIIFAVGTSLVNVTGAVLNAGNESVKRLLIEWINLALTISIVYHLYRGHIWAKWATSVIIILGAALYGLRALQVFFVPGAFSAWGVLITFMVAVNAAFGVLLVISNDIKAFMKKQRMKFA